VTPSRHAGDDTGGKIARLVDWLVDGARPAQPTPAEWLRVVCERMQACGLRMERVAVFARPLHPNVAARAFYWRAGTAAVEVTEEGHAFMNSAEHLASPVYRVTSTGETVRRRICDPRTPMDFEVLHDLRRDGFTDYCIMPLEFIDGEVDAWSVATRAADGFDAAEMDAFARIRPALARMVEILALTRRTASILDAYLGHHAGARVLDGRIRRGDTENIHAVLWFCDLRDSTVLAEALAPQQYLGVLNDYFDCVLAPLMRLGGEVLSFVGDAALAIFPTAEDPTDAATRAVRAAREAVAAMRALNARRTASGEIPLRFGIGLHLGDVLYGNVGTPSRIAFTVVGAATNEAARIEAACKTIDAPLLASAPVARHAPFAWRSAGEHRLRGVERPMELFTLDD
jgi:adenylate cyclase